MFYFYMHVGSPNLTLEALEFSVDTSVRTWKKSVMSFLPFPLHLLSILILQEDILINKNVGALAVLFYNNLLFYRPVLFYYVSD